MKCSQFQQVRRIKLLSFLVAITLLTASCAGVQNTNSTSSGSNGSRRTTPTTQLKASFQDRVQSVCNSVDSQVFIDILSVDPIKDPTYVKKFEDAIDAIEKLKVGFAAITPPKSKEESWKKGIANLNDLKSQVSTVLVQYKEYVSLTEESKTNKDPIRSIQIIDRLLKLAGEYAATLQLIQASFDQMLKVGVDAGIARCSAFEVN